jgi:hypothetical protein
MNKNLNIVSDLFFDIKFIQPLIFIYLFSYYIIQITIS